MPRRKVTKRKLPRVIYVYKTMTGKSVKARDKRVQAMKPGKRLSKNRKTYYERRKNRCDLGKWF